MVSEKRCRKCYKVKPAREFEIVEANKDGLHSYCRECHRALSREWKAKHADKVRIYQTTKGRGNSQRWRDKHREIKRADSLIYARDRADDPQVKTRTAEWRKNNRQKLRDKNNGNNRQRKLRVVAAYGSACYCCGETRLAFLTIDHVNNDGAEWKRHYKGRLRGGYNLYRLIEYLGYPTDLRLACWNCNVGRYHNGNICPHEEERLALVA